MFKKLRNKFILTNLVSTTLVLFVAFSSIYVVAAASNSQRPPTFHNVKQYSEEISDYLDERLTEEREISLKSLLISLIITGACVEFIVALTSFYLAEQYIKPVKETYLAQKEFIANASHEIKTPLAVIQANLEAADIHDNHWIDNVATKVEDLAALNAELLTLARIEANTLEKSLEKINLKGFIKETIAPLTPQITKKKATLKLRTKNLKKTDPTINKPALKQLLNILLDNAIKYADKQIIITLSDNKIEIQNDGATISKTDLPHIFDRFYQTDKTKNGVGLGLAIAKQLADSNNWKLAATSTDKYTTFTLTI